MARFKVTWDTGLVTEYEQSDCQTVEQFINCRFGAGVEVTAQVEIIGEKAEVPPAEPVKAAEPVEIEAPAEPVKVQEPTKAAEPVKTPAAKPKAPVKAG